MDISEIDAELQQIKSQMAMMLGITGEEETGDGEDFLRSGDFGGEVPRTAPGGSGMEMFEWDSEKQQIGAGKVMVGRKIISVQASSEGLGDHKWAVAVTFGSSETPTVQFEQWDNEDENTDSKTYLPLYTIEDGEMKEDLRSFFTVQCWE